MEASGDIAFSLKRERLEALMLFRVILVTLFLGGALLVDVGALADFSNVRNTTIVGLIVGTYGLTIFYALLLRAEASLTHLAVTQLSLDIVVVGVLVDAYGGIESPFLFLFLLVVISTALTLGRRAAVNAAVGVSLMLVVLAAERIGLFDAEPAAGWVWKATLFRVGLNGSAAVIVALLSGYLTERLGEATSRLEAQQASLDELRALHNNILASLSSGLITLDPRGEVIFINTSAEQILDMRAEDLLGQKIDDVIPEMAGVGLDAGRRGEIEVLRGGKESVYIGFSTSPLISRTTEAEDGRIVIFQDLSEIKHLESEVRRSERLAAVGRLAAAIAHEIRNPLASISGSVEMLSEAETTSDDDRALMAIVLREVIRLDELITEFLEYSRARKLALGDHTPEEILNRVLELFQHREKGLEITLDVQPTLPTVRVDIEAMSQVFWNLFNNAAEAAGDKVQINAGARRSERGVLFWVEDNGSGIADDDLDRIFQPFFTTKPTGTGLGLATLFRIVEDHGARCHVIGHGELGGARFEIEFPIEKNS